MILLHHGGHAHPRSPVGATITVLLFGQPPARFGVEQIAVRSACAEASLPSIVRRLALGDVPTSIWWTEDLSHTTPVQSLVSMARQLVYDSRQWRDIRAGVAALAAMAAQEGAPDLADLNWRRLAAMRQALTEARHPKEPSYLERRLACRLGQSRFHTNAQPGALSNVGRHGDDLVAASLGDEDPGDISAAMNGHRVLVKYRGRLAPFSVAVPRESEADAVAAELRNLTHDVVLRDALVTLARRFTSSGSL